MSDRAARVPARQCDSYQNLTKLPCWVKKRFGGPCFILFWFHICYFMSPTRYYSLPGCGSCFVCAAVPRHCLFLYEGALFLRHSDYRVNKHWGYHSDSSMSRGTTLIPTVRAVCFYIFSPAPRYIFLLVYITCLLYTSPSPRD